VSDVKQPGVSLVVSSFLELGYDVRVPCQNEATVTLPVTSADGQVTTFQIAISGAGPKVFVGEDPSCRLLPPFCPERHIVAGGRFCMYWERDMSFDVVDRESAHRWIDLLLDFLRSQRRAAYLRRWPTDDTWAHGEGAAVAQRDAERISVDLKGEWAAWVLQRQLIVERNAGGIFSVFRAECFLYSVWVVPNRRTRLGGPILGLCEASSRGRRLSRKRSRGRILYRLADSLYRWRTAEAAFWTVHAGMPCCGSIDTCRLRKTA
jgi:hypothetical protein